MYAGPISGFFRTGVCTIAWPITEAASQEAGFVLNACSVQAFCSVLSREERALGIWIASFAMFACPIPAEVTLIFKFVPLALLPCPTAEAVSFGANGRLWQFVTWNGEDTGILVPWPPVRVPVILIGLQFVGLNVNCGRSTSTSICLSWAGTPFTNVGNGSLSIVTAAVAGFTLILERTSTSPRLKGPATAGVITSSPNGAPLYPTVR